MNTLFKPQAGSPSTELAADITDTATEITVVDVSVLPEAPNILTMIEIEGDSFESIIYESVDEANNKLTDVTRGVEGQQLAWSTGQEIARNFTAKDLKALQYWVIEAISVTDLSKDKSADIVSFSSSGINEDTLEFYDFVDEVQLNITWGTEADTITEINIDDTTVINETDWSVSGTTLTIDSQPLIDYVNDTFDLIIEFNDEFVIDTVATTVLVPENDIETDEGTIMSETTLTEPTINPTSTDVNEYDDELEAITVDWGTDADSINVITINNDEVLAESEWAVSVNTLTIQSQNILNYANENNLSSFNLNINFNDGYDNKRTTRDLALTIIATGIESDEGTIMSETTLA